MRFRTYLNDQTLEEDLGFTPALLPAIYAAIGLFSAASQNRTAKGVMSTMLQLLNQLTSFGVKDEFVELMNDPKLNRAIRFGGESGERRAEEILKRHMKDMPPAKVKRLEKAFKKIKSDQLIKMTLDD